MKRIKIDLLAASTIGMNQSGMKTQIDTLYDYLRNDSLLDVKKYDIWSYRNPDIVHVFGMGEGMYSHLKLLKSQGVLIVCSPNHWPTNSRVDKILMKINIKDVIFSNRVAKNFLLKNSDMLVVNSEAEKKLFVETFGVKNERINVIYNSYGEEPVPFGNLFLKKYNLANPYCLMVGQIGSERKNQLRVLKIWKNEFPDLVILGGITNSSYAKKCLSVIESKTNIIYLGFESDYRIIESAYQNCKLFISPGIIETPSLAALRALLNGAKVCSTNNGGAPNEYFKNNAIYFDPFEEHEILKSIEIGLSNNWEINCGDLKRFSDSSILPRYKNIYLNI